MKKLISMSLLAVLDALAHYWVAICGLIVLALVGEWSYGYHMNNTHGAHYDLASCWQGIQVITGAGCIGLGKYLTDSWLNTEKGQYPPLPKSIQEVIDYVRASKSIEADNSCSPSSGASDGTAS